jgi:hypothetical protein
MTAGLGGCQAKLPETSIRGWFPGLQVLCKSLGQFFDGILIARIMDINAQPVAFPMRTIGADLERNDDYLPDAVYFVTVTDLFGGLVHPTAREHPVSNVPDRMPKKK